MKKDKPLPCGRCGHIPESHKGKCVYGVTPRLTGEGNFGGCDCVVFVEPIEAMARAILQQRLDFPADSGSVKTKVAKVKKPKIQSRPQKWSNAVADALSAVGELLEIQQEYEEMLDNLPDGLENSSFGEKLQEVNDIDIQGMADILNESEDVDLPLGFGRD